MDFKENGHIVIRNAVQKDVVEYLVEYLTLKERVADILYDKGYTTEERSEWGTWSDEQSLGAYSNYSDIAIETLLTRLQPVIEKFTGLNLVPNYSYSRVYVKGNILEHHVDRDECEISATLNLGGDFWPIYIGSGMRIDLNPGDALVYLGAVLPHWRERFEGSRCYQAFFHYNEMKPDGTTVSAPLDGRLHLGLPSAFKELGNE